MIKVIGGYFELETFGVGKYHPNAIKLNSGRSALRYAIRAYGIKELFVPYYTCPVVWEAVREENCGLRFYDVNKDFRPMNALPTNAFILYNNYFGVCDINTEELSKVHSNLIVDNAQSFYSKARGIASFYSPRKFFGLPDGGLLMCDKRPDEQFERDLSFDRMTHLLKRHDLGASGGYEDFKANDSQLSGQPIKEMSNLTDALMSNIDYARVRKKRIDNFQYLHIGLSSINELILNENAVSCPMVYPLLINSQGLRDHLISRHIYVAKYWDGIEQTAPFGSYSLYLRNYLLPLPVDQRYDLSDMAHIINIIKEYLAVR